jgi:diguanylate cyclase (GGDEF)-like protein
MMDIDHFKDINDKFGHRAGDEALQQIAQVLLSTARTCDLPARYGGDEFAIVMPETCAEAAWQAAERVRKVVENEPIKVNCGNDSIEKIKIALSMGVAVYPGDADSSETLIEAANQACYQAKLHGRNRVVRFHAGQARGDS